MGAATLAAEIFAAWQGADYIRTHDVAAIRDALTVLKALTHRAAGQVLFRFNGRRASTAT